MHAKSIFIKVEPYIYWACGIGLLTLGSASKILGQRFWPYLFVLLSSFGIAWMLRHFIFARPGELFDRTLATEVRFSRRDQVILVVGFAMCVPMLALGCIGLANPSLMNRMVGFLSPIRFLLS
jgi:hypothetical protein